MPNVIISSNIIQQSEVRITYTLDRINLLYVKTISHKNIILKTNKHLGISLHATHMLHND